MISVTRKILLEILLGLLLALVGFGLGLIGGAMIGGNFFTEFEFNGVRGYEAVGQIGAIVGTIVFGALGVWAGAKIGKHTSSS